jgi:hypothetical protein
MNSARLTNLDIRRLGWQALIEKLGPSGALRFAMQTERGHGDFAETRHRMLGRRNVDELLALMRKQKRRDVARPRGRRRR